MIRREEQKERTHLLIIGLPRSGTSLLSSLLGAHSKVAIVNEDFGRSWMDVIGKPVVGNKLCVPRQIAWSRKRNALIKVANRLGFLKLWPKSLYSVKDYLKIPGIKIISIHRSHEDVRNSIKSRGSITRPRISGGVEEQQISEKEIEYTIKKGSKALKKLKGRKNVMEIDFEDLLTSTEELLEKIFSFINLYPEDHLVELGTRWNWMYPESKKGLDQSKVSQIDSE